MPAHPKTSETQIVQATRQLVEAKGLAGFSMSDVAAAVGIRAPSLYSRFKDRADLLGAVDLQICAELAALLRAALVADDPAASVMAQAQAIRNFARTNPNCYSLLFDLRGDPTEAGKTAREAVLDPFLPSLVALAGELGAFGAARVLLPFLHGFISMELASAFRLGGGLDEAFENGVRVILRGVASQG
jgi:AcrR family transcriptional regulator